jgi:hypothetical protein
VRYGSRKTAVTRYDRPDGALWFTEQSSGKIGRITTGGVITEVVSGGSYPLGMTAGPDRALWFMLFHNSAIARAPACALGLTAGFDSRFARNTLRAAFERGVARPAIWTIVAGSTILLNKGIAPVTPPRGFSLSCGSFPNAGDVTLGLRSLPDNHTFDNSDTESCNYTFLVKDAAKKYILKVDPFSFALESGSAYLTSTTASLPKDPAAVGVGSVITLVQCGTTNYTSAMQTFISYP